MSESALDANSPLVDRMIDFNRGANRCCPHCGRFAKSVKRVDGAVYALPCMCRVWTGDLPLWAEDER